MWGKRIFQLCLITIYVLPAIGSSANRSASAQLELGACRLGITVPYSLDGYPIESIGVDSILDWRVSRPAALPGYMTHLKVLRVRDDYFPQHLANLPGWLASYPGSFWVIGNEPDTYHGNQDNNTPEEYAVRFYQMATAIRNNDSSARIGFAPLVQPTPLRLRYLDRVLDRLDDSDLAGSPAAARDLIDVYTPHMFILNEQANSWGAGIPPGFENDHADAMVLSDPEDTHNIEIFKSLARNFRQWLKNNDEQEKPVWITEFGSLLPPLDPPGGPDHYNVSDTVTRDYMLAAFSYLLGPEGRDFNTGLPADDYRLVQRAYWYSLNEYRWKFGGALFDSTSYQLSLVGEGFRDYNPLGLVQAQNPDVYPVSGEVLPFKYSHGSAKSRVDYLVRVQIGNHVSYELLTQVEVSLKVDGNLVDTQPGVLARCGGIGFANLIWLGGEPGVQHTLEATVSVQPTSGVDIDATNNTLTWTITPALPLESWLPNSYR